MATPAFYHQVRQLGRKRRERSRSKSLFAVALVVLFGAGLYSVRGFWRERNPQPDQAAKPSRRTPIDAYLALEQDLRREPLRHDVRRRAAEAALQLKRFQEAKAHLLILAKADPTNGPLQHLLGKAYEGAEEYDNATLAYAEATKHAPKQLKSYIQGAVVLRQQLKRAADADQVMEALVAANPHSVQAYLTRAQYRQRFGLPGVDKDVRRAEELAPDDSEVLLVASQVACAQGKARELRNYLERGTRLYTKDKRFLSLLLKLELQEHRLDEAIACLRRLIDVTNDKGRQSAVWTLGNLLLEAKRPRESRLLIDRLHAEGYAPWMVAYLDARLLMGEGQWREAATTLQGLRSDLKKWPSWLRQACLRLNLCYWQLGDPERQVGACRDAVTADPLSAPAHYELASALLAAGRLDDALKEYRVMIRLRQVPPAGWRVLLRLLVLQNLRQPKAQRRWEEIEKLLAQAEWRMPASATVVVLRAEVLAARKGVATARKLLQETCARKPKEIELWIALADFARRGGDERAALTTLTQARHRVGSTASLRLARMRVWPRNQVATQDLLAPLCACMDPFSDAEKMGILEEAGDLLYGAEPAQAEDFYQEALKLQTHSLRLRLRLAELACRPGQETALLAHLQEIERRAGPDGILGPLAEEARDLVNAWQRGFPLGLERAKEKLAAATSAFWRGPEAYVEHELAKLHWN